MKLVYEGYDRSGAPVSAEIEAASPSEARSELRSKGVFVLELHEAGAKPSKPSSKPAGKAARSKHTKPRGARTLKGRASLDHIAQFTRELSVLVSTGTPLADAIRALERQEKEDAWRGVVTDLRRRVEEGASLSQAMSAVPGRFDPVVTSLIEAGEESGELDSMLMRLAGLVRQQIVVRRAVVGAMTYPCVLLTLSMASVVTILMVVVPRFAGMFDSLDAPIPASTEALVVIGTGLNAYWWAVLTGVLGAAAGLWLWLRSGVGRRSIDRWAVHAPLVGPLVRKLSAARISRLLGTLLSAHLPLVEALDLLAGSLPNAEYRSLVERARSRVIEGESLAIALDSGAMLTPSFIEAIRNGESTGRLAAVLSNLSEHLDEDNRAAVGTLSKSIEPIVIGLMGIVIGFLALSMFLPLFDLTSAVSPGGAP